MTTLSNDSDLDGLLASPRLKVLLNAELSARIISPRKQLSVFSGASWVEPRREPSPAGGTEASATGGGARRTDEESGLEDGVSDGPIELHEVDVPAGGSPTPVSTWTKLRPFVQFLAMFAIYMGVYTGCFVFILRVKVNLSAAPLYYPAGLYLYMLLLGGPLVLPLLVAFDLLMASQFAVTPITGDVTIGGTFTAYILKGVVFGIVSLGMRYFVDFRLHTWRHYSVFGFFALVCAILNGIVVAGVVLMMGRITKEGFGASLYTRALQDLTGIMCCTTVLLVFTPIVLIRLPRAWARLRRHCPRFRVVLRTLYRPFVGCLLLVAALLFGGSGSAPRLYLFFIPVSYIAAFFGRAGGCLFSLFNIFWITIWAHQAWLLSGRAYFTLSELQLFFVVLSAQGHALGISVDSDTSKEVALRRTLAKLEQKTMELAASNKEAARLAAAKAQFLDDVSHEVRTPLHGMLGYLSLLLASPLTTAQKRWVSTMQGSASLLTSIVDDLLDISKVSNGKVLPMRPINFSLAVALEDALTLTAGMQVSAGVEIMSVVEPSLGHIVFTDRQNLQRVVLNLLSNALKFTREGAVILRARLLDKQPSSMLVHISVSDTGTGIRPEVLPLLFNRFAQAPATVVTPDEQLVEPPPGIKGTGLGLAISKDLVERGMKGQIGVESDFGRGATFWFTAHFPLPAPPTPLIAPHTAPVASTGSTGAAPADRPRQPCPIPLLRSSSDVSGHSSMAVKGLVIHPCASVRAALVDMFALAGAPCEAVASLDEAVEMVFKIDMTVPSSAAGSPHVSESVTGALPMLPKPARHLRSRRSSESSAGREDASVAPGLEHRQPIGEATAASAALLGSRGSVGNLTTARGTPIPDTPTGTGPSGLGLNGTGSGFGGMVRRHLSDEDPRGLLRGSMKGKQTPVGGARSSKNPFPSASCAWEAPDVATSSTSPDLSRDGAKPADLLVLPAPGPRQRSPLGRGLPSHGPYSPQHPASSSRGGHPSLLVVIDSSFSCVDVMLFSARTKNTPGAPPITLALATSSLEALDPMLVPGGGLVDTTLRKPMCHSSLCALIGAVNAGEALQEVEAAPVEGPSPGNAREGDAACENLTGIRVMVVDDNAVNRELAFELLLHLGIREEDIIMAEDGDKATKAYVTALSDPMGPVNIILMDCSMPVLDGFGAARWIRDYEARAVLAHRRDRRNLTGLGATLRPGQLGLGGGGSASGAVTPGTPASSGLDGSRVASLAAASRQRVPIMAVTAYSFDSCRDRCADAGMDGFLMKPFTEEALKECIVRWIQPHTPMPNSLGVDSHGSRLLLTGGHTAEDEGSDSEGASGSWNRNVPTRGGKIARGA